MKTLVVGMGKSGKGAARLLQHLGHEVVGMDQNLQALVGIRPLRKEEGSFDMIVLSPGVPPHCVEVPEGCEIVGEAELAFRYMKNRSVGITGTNGKTSLTLLITHALNIAGVRARALGNVGRSLCEYLINPDSEEVLIVELSSFQLETMTSRALDEGVIINITPDHLDRYHSFEAYAAVKCCLGRLVKGELLVGKEVNRRFQALLPKENLRVLGSDFYLQLKKEEQYLRLLGSDVVECAFAVCKKFGITWEEFEGACRTFRRPEHRLEYVGEVGGVRFYNDSKATNVAAVAYAVGGVAGVICLIAGGRIKGGCSFGEWRRSFPGKVREIFVIGEAAEQIERELSDTVPVRRCPNLQRAVWSARKEARSGEAVLLSPGCSSLDQFCDYEARGDQFKECVFNLRKMNS